MNHFKLENEIDREKDSLFLGALFVDKKQS